MSTKLNPEEIAAKRYRKLGWLTGRPHWPNEYDRFREDGYAAAIREVAQPLADELDAYRDALKKWRDRFEYEADNKHVEDLVNETSAILTKYNQP